MLCHRVPSVAPCSLAPRTSAHTSSFGKREGRHSKHAPQCCFAAGVCGTLRTGRAWFPTHCHLGKPHYVWKGYRRSVFPRSSHGGHLAFSTTVAVGPRLLTVGNGMFVPRGFLWPHSATAPQAHSHGVLSCTSAQGASLVGQRPFSNTCVRERHQMSVARRCPHLDASERRGDSTGLTFSSPAARCRHY